MQAINFDVLRATIGAWEKKASTLEKFAMVPGPQAPPPQGGPPVDPQTGMPIDPQTGMPVDPQTGMPIDPQTGMPIDPQTGQPMQGPPPGGPGGPPPGPGGPPPGPGGPPPGDPNAGGAPGGPPPGPGGPPPEGGGGLGPEGEQILSEVAGGMQEMAQTVESQQQQMDQITERMLALEQKEQDRDNKEKLKEANPFEGSTKTRRDVEESVAPQNDSPPIPFR